MTNVFARETMRLVDEQIAWLENMARQAFITHRSQAGSFRLTHEGDVVSERFAVILMPQMHIFEAERLSDFPSHIQAVFAPLASGEGRE